MVSLAPKKLYDSFGHVWKSALKSHITDIQKMTLENLFTEFFILLNVCFIFSYRILSDLVAQSAHPIARFAYNGENAGEGAH